MPMLPGSGVSPQTLSISPSGEGVKGWWTLAGFERGVHPLSDGFSQSIVSVLSTDQGPGVWCSFKGAR
jgi:hypothetical protein